MERRPDPQYDFNNPLLETLLEQWHQEGVSEVVVSQFFLLPGRHAGPDGDLAEICQPFIEKGMKVFRTETLGHIPWLSKFSRSESAGWGLVHKCLRQSGEYKFPSRMDPARRRIFTHFPIVPSVKQSLCPSQATSKMVQNPRLE